MAISCKERPSGPLALLVLLRHGNLSRTDHFIGVREVRFTVFLLYRLHCVNLSPPWAKPQVILRLLDFPRVLSIDALILRSGGQDRHGVSIDRPLLLVTELVPQMRDNLTLMVILSFSFETPLRLYTLYVVESRHRLLVDFQIDLKTPLWDSRLRNRSGFLLWLAVKGALQEICEMRFFMSQVSLLLLWGICVFFKLSLHNDLSLLVLLVEMLVIHAFEILPSHDYGVALEPLSLLNPLTSALTLEIRLIIFNVG